MTARARYLGAMPLLFETLLKDAGLQPGQVRILRHPERRGLDLLALWRSDRARFEAFQALQKSDNQSQFRSPHWATCVGRGSKTIFLGIYTATLARARLEGVVDPIWGHVMEAPHDEYRTELTPLLSEFSGRLFISWRGQNWRQLGSSGHEIVGLHDGALDPPFPGYLKFKKQLSEIATLPEAWAEQLRTGKGIYLITCPETRLHYVGKAVGAESFWGRWTNYAANGHGGNKLLRERPPTDYQITILEVAGSAASEGDIAAMESLWKEKLKSREMGLNAN